MQARWRGQVQCVYIDPPFNTGKDFLYKDTYRFSSWLALLDDRLRSCRPLLTASASLFVHLDYNANYLGRMLLDGVMGPSNFVNEIIWRIGWVSGYKTQVDAFVRNHDTLFFYANNVGEHYFDKPRARIPYVAHDRKTIADELDAIMAAWDVDPRQVATTKLAFKYPDGRVFKLGLSDNEAGYNIEDTWNSSEYEDLNSNKIKRNAAEYTPNGSEITQKPEDLLRRVIDLTSREGEVVLDFFGGSGTTAAVAWKLGRKFVTSEVEHYFDDDLLWRFKQLLNGRSVGISRVVGPKSGGCVKYVRLESYEDALNNLDVRRTGPQQLLLGAPEAQGPDALREQYLLRYFLNVETRGNPSLLNVGAFADPTAYRLTVKPPGSDESRDAHVDLLETFNWLTGLRVRRVAAPRTYAAEFARDAEGRLRLTGALTPDPDGPYWFRAVTGTTPDGRAALVVWRKRPGGDEPAGVEQDNLVLDAWFAAEGHDRDDALDVVWVNGPHNLGALRPDGAGWQVRLIEDDFHRLMFEDADA